ncbi:Tbf5 domain-containing protein [Rhizoctonia solani AG-1 IA]|uniref:RNA polymerase II transcription factor B subunit 5 n=1 Tax=Thanatephorus cucumeris (strain AG1-IA) TaxID=983506 RepID=L8WQ29_THACA|nr:Tbf5 domain-containing protein [Rhizoctonia solani AG-1 IA]
MLSLALPLSYYGHLIGFNEPFGPSSNHSSIVTVEPYKQEHTVLVNCTPNVNLKEHALANIEFAQSRPPYALRLSRIVISRVENVWPSWMTKQRHGAYTRWYRNNRTRMRAFKGVLLTCDPAVKQILLILDKMPGQGGFIIKDIDDTHVLVRADDVKRIRIALEQESEYRRIRRSGMRAAQRRHSKVLIFWETSAAGRPSTSTTGRFGLALLMPGPADPEPVWHPRSLISRTVRGNAQTRHSVYTLCLAGTMLSARTLLMRPVLYAHTSTQIRAFSLARIALEPVRKATPPPPPPPAAKGKAGAAAIKYATKSTSTDKTAAPAKKASSATTKTTSASASAAPAPAKRVRLTEKERAARDRGREREKIAKQKEREREREKARKAKEREKEHEKKEKAKARELAKKEKEKAKAEMAKAIKKPYPPPPRAPATAYLLFTSDRTVDRDRGEGVTEDAIKASQAWKDLSDVYTKKAEQARAAWKEDVAKWVSTLNLAQLHAARANREPGTRDDAALNVLPKRPGNGYALFLSDVTSRQDFRDKVDALVKKEHPKDEKDLVQKRISLYGRTSADIWRSMSDKEKVYSNKATEAKAQWDKKFGHLIAEQKEEIAAAHQ